MALTTNKKTTGSYEDLLKATSMSIPSLYQAPKSPTGAFYTTPQPTSVQKSGLTNVGPVNIYGQTQTTPTIGTSAQPVAPTPTMSSTTPAAPVIKTQPRPTTVVQQPTATTPAPIGSAQNLAARTGFSFTANPADAAAQKEIDAYYDAQRTLANETIDPNKIYTDNLTKFQAEIDSINNIYNDMLNQSRITNAPTYQRRLGSGASLAVNQGLTGSNVGESNIRTIEEANAQEQLAQEAIINEKRNMAIANIMGEVRKSSLSELEAKKLAKAQGADKLIEYLKGTPTRRAGKISSAITALLAQGFKISDLTKEELDTLVKETGATKDELTSAYKVAESDAAAKAKKEEQDAMKALPAAAQEYEYAKSQGYKGSFTQYQNEDANRKARAVSQPRLTLSEQQAGVVQRLAAGLVPGQLIPNSGGVPFIDNNGFLTVDGFKAAINAAQQTGLPRKEFLQEFGSYLAPTLLASYGVTPKEIKDISGALPEQEK